MKKQQEETTKRSLWLLYKLYVWKSAAYFHEKFQDITKEN